MLRTAFPRGVALVSGVVYVLVLCCWAVPALAQQGPWPMPQVLLEVHPNERAPGQFSNQYIGGPPWTNPGTGPSGSYFWQYHVFAGSDVLWIQVCAQCWTKTQNQPFAGLDDDNMMLDINGLRPPDYDWIMSGTGSWQWRGDKMFGKRHTYRFLYIDPLGPGIWKHQISIGADEAPVLWWLKVTDLEEQMVYPLD